MIRSRALTQVQLGGVIDADAKGSWIGSLRDLVADVNASVHSSIASPNPAPAAASQSTPVEGAIHARYSARTRQISLARSSLHTPQTTLSFDGVIGSRSNLHVELRVNSLQEAEKLATILRPTSPAQPARPLDLHGTALFRGTVRGSLQQPLLSGQLTARNLHVMGSQFRLLHVDIDADPSQVSLDNGELDPDRVASSASTCTPHCIAGPMLRKILLPFPRTPSRAIAGRSHSRRRSAGSAHGNTQCRRCLERFGGESDRQRKAIVDARDLQGRADPGSQCGVRGHG